MPVISLNSTQPCDSCYIFRISVGNYTSGSLVIEIGNGNFTPVGTVATLTANGSYEIEIDPTDFDCTTGFNSIRITPTGWGAGIYFVQGLFLSDGCATRQCSQCFDLAPHLCTLKFQYSNNSNAFGFDYEHFNFVQEIRVEGDMRRPRYPETNNQYTTSRGNTVLVSFDSHERNEVRIDLAPEYIHNALRLMRGHRNVYINGNRYTPLQQEYSPEWRNDTVLAQARFEVRKYNELNKNSNCI